MSITARCPEATFSITGEEEAERIKGIDVIKHLWKMLYRSDDDWPEVLRKILKARQVWGQLGKFLWR